MPVRLADPANNEAKMKLAEIYEITNETRKALDLVYEGGLFVDHSIPNCLCSCSHRFAQEAQDLFKCSSRRIGTARGHVALCRR